MGDESIAGWQERGQLTHAPSEWSGYRCRQLQAGCQGQAVKGLGKRPLEATGRFYRPASLIGGWPTMPHLSRHMP